VSEKSARSNPDSQKFPKWNAIRQLYVRRCSFGFRKIGHKDYSRRKAGLKKEIRD
jgi:hypothetical protein